MPEDKEGKKKQARITGKAKLKRAINKASMYHHVSTIEHPIQHLSRYLQPHYHPLSEFHHQSMEKVHNNPYIEHMDNFDRYEFHHSMNKDHKVHVIKSKPDKIEFQKIPNSKLKIKHTTEYIPQSDNAQMYIEKKHSQIVNQDGEFWQDQNNYWFRQAPNQNLVHPYPHQNPSPLQNPQQMGQSQGQYSTPFMYGRFQHVPVQQKNEKTYQEQQIKEIQYGLQNYGYQRQLDVNDRKNMNEPQNMGGAFGHQTMPLPQQPMSNAGWQGDYGVYQPYRA